MGARPVVVKVRAQLLSRNENADWPEALPHNRLRRSAGRQDRSSRGAPPEFFARRGSRSARPTTPGSIGTDGHQFLLHLGPEFEMIDLSLPGPLPTRSRVGFFMNRVRKLGFIDYPGGNDVRVHGSLLNIVLHD
jgi:hypothetical protein